MVIYHTYIYISSYMSHLIVDSETLLIKDKKQKQQISTYIYTVLKSTGLKCFKMLQYVVTLYLFHSFSSGHNN